MNDLRSASYRLEESRRLVYERRYHKQYEKAKSELISDSTNFSLVSKNFFRLYSFTDLKESWVQYINIKKDSENKKTLKMHNDLILQICRNRWTEGIYDIKLKEITSRKVTVNQGDVPVLAAPNSFNDLEMAWTKSKKEFLANLSEDDPFRDIGFDLIVEFMKPNLLFDQQLTERKAKRESR